MRFLTMLATKCKVCKKRSTCNYKRMVACALAELPPQHTCRIIAWMPLPKPYLGSDKDE